jgi:hypothetical protein
VRVDREFIEKMKVGARERGHRPSRWVAFSDIMLGLGYEVDVYRVQGTRSRYVRVYVGKEYYKVRFSDHAPNLTRENYNDCDYYVGVSNHSVGRMMEAVRRAKEHLGPPDKGSP